MSTNEISVEITQEKDNTVNHFVDKLTTELNFLIDLDIAGRRAIAKMGRRNLDLVERTFQYAEDNPEFTPPYISLAEFKKDVDLSKWLRKLEKKVGLIFDKIKDTAMLAESDAYQAARLVYGLVKDAAGAGNEKAEFISRDLGVHFKRLGPKNPETARKKQNKTEPKETPTS